MKITKIEATEAYIPIEAPIVYAYGLIRGFSRTIVEVHTDDGLVGISETGASAQQVEEIGDVAVGQNPFDLEIIKMLISSRYYQSRDALIAASIEMACIDIQGKATGLPAYRLLGGAIRPTVPLVAYCFYRHGTDDFPPVWTPDELAAHAADLVRTYGYGTVKLKGGVQEPSIEVATIEALRERLGPDIHLRLDPQAAWAPGTAIEMAPRLERAGLQYYEDPTAGATGMALVRSRTSLPLATNMCVMGFPELGPAARVGAIDVVLSDPWYFGGVTQVRALATVCSVLGLGMGMHSGLEFGIGLAIMAHTAVTLPTLTYAVDSHYHHLTDDLILGPRLLPAGDGRITPPDGPGWGVEIDRDKLGRYAELSRSVGEKNAYWGKVRSTGPDPYRPGWFPVIPGW